MSPDGSRHPTPALDRLVPLPLDLAASATVRNASALRRSVRRWLDPVLPPDLADDVTLAVYEAVVNAVDHAFTTRPGPGTVRLVGTATGEHVTITISDDGVWLVPGDPGTRGHGSALIRDLVTAARTETGPGGTTVRLRQRRHVAPPGSQPPPAAPPPAAPLG